MFLSPNGQRRALKQLASRAFEPCGEKAMRPCGDPPFAPWALGHCEWLQPLGKGFSGVSAPGADLRPAEGPPQLHTHVVGPRGQEFKEHAFEWLKLLAMTERPRGEGRTTLERSVQVTALPFGA